MKFTIPNSFLNDKPLDVWVVGAGGTGSILLGGLAQMAVALKELGHPGLNVTVYDDDLVSPANIGRQAFTQSDIGQSKVRVLVNRINLTFGLTWTAVAERLEPAEEYSQRNGGADILIGCVDTRVARKTIETHWIAAARKRRVSLWLDCGNEAISGQVVLGARSRNQVAESYTNKAGKWVAPIVHDQINLPSAADLFPEMVNPSFDLVDEQPSCSVREALTKQDLMINRTVADVALNILWQLLRHGEIMNHGAFVNLRTMRTNPLPVDPAGWLRMGFDASKQEYKPPRKRRTKAELQAA